MAYLSHLLVVECSTAVEDRALVVVDIVTQAVVEVHTQRKALPVKIQEDITIDVGIGIANDGLITLINLAVIVQVFEVDVARCEVVLGTRLVKNIEVGSLGISRRREDTLCLIAVEHTHGVANRRQYILVAVD